MDGITALFLGIQGLVWLALAVILIFLIVRRIKIKKKEDFEKRDN